MILRPNQSPYNSLAHSFFFSTHLLNTLNRGLMVSSTRCWSLTSLRLRRRASLTEMEPKHDPLPRLSRFRATFSNYKFPTQTTVFLLWSEVLTVSFTPPRGAFAMPTQCQPSIPVRHSLPGIAGERQSVSLVDPCASLVSDRRTFSSSTVFIPFSHRLRETWQNHNTLAQAELCSCLPSHLPKPDEP